MKKTLFLLAVATIAYCFVSCKKECICWGGIEWTYDDGVIAIGEFGESSVGKLNNTDCKNFEGLTKIERDEQKGCTITTNYGGCQLQ
jgi:hypothetical protein